MKLKTVFTVVSTDSKELLCKARRGQKASRPWFWVPEEGTLRAFKMSQADTLRGITTRAQVESILTSDLV